MILQEKDCTSKKQSKRQKRMSVNKEKTCPLCLETLDVDDLSFYPCKCGYQVCRFCWHRIRTNENGLCPACRRQYSEDPVTFKPLTQEEVLKLRNEKKMKDMQKKKEIAENRKQLANIRVVQKNLVYVHGLPLGLDVDDDRYKKINNIFKEFGTVVKFVINNRTNYAGSQSPRASAYVTYQKIEDALRAYKKLPSIKIEGHEIKTSLGTTKYCSNFLKNVHCSKVECMYLHEMADEELSFTKEEIHSGQHLNCGNMLYDRMMSQITNKIIQNSQPKESPPEEPEIEPERPNTEKVNSKEESSESSDESSHSPVQSRLQRLYINNETQNPPHGSSLENRFAVNSNVSTDNPRNTVSNSEPQVQPSLSSEETSVNNATVSNLRNKVKQLHHSIQDMFNGDMWHEPKNTVTPQTNHLQNNFHQNDFNILSSGNSTSSIFRLPFSNNEPKNSLSERESFESRIEQDDDDLGFDPCQFSLDALKAIVDSEAKTTPRANVLPKNSFGSIQKPTAVQNQQVRLRAIPQVFQQRMRNPPPPGFAANSFPSTQQQLPSPVYETRAPTSNRMSPVINTFNTALRPNFPIARFQSHNSVGNGYTPIRTMPPQSIHDLMSRSALSTQQQLPSQRLENIPMQQQQQQFPTGDQQNLSPSYWSLNQTQWMATPENFQNLSIPKFRPTNSQINNFALAQQFRNDEIQRRVQQITAQYNSLSPFTEGVLPSLFR
ncbi:CCR4-NOT transcription complex subunit 4 [Trichonephila inaurata madagascariensis]|uniref:CCR4-NOT transcription complex subunit 4 n=1 Tax=Trichonephila inaurata madagascariensis TaxID=2747483 RepID=A0A8X7CHC6_9ARAC|nr:CCR4-NOT transcription complex subunit 4 [Trichonephila inaurata madagascariensis]